jgi:chromosome segregation ATPase
MDFSPDKIRARFHELTAERAKIDAKLEPLREERDGILQGESDLTVKKANARRHALDEKIEKLQQELAPIENERAACARALGGKTGEAAQTGS